MLLVSMALAAPVCAIRPHTDVIHAVTMEELLAAMDGRETVTAPCGADGLKVIGEQLGQENVLLWPPSTRGFKSAVRCRDCWERTGKKRPRCWKAS